MRKDISANDIFTAILDILMPRRCVVCGRVLALRERYICISCLADFPRTYFSWLSRNQMADRLNDMLRRDYDEGEFRSPNERYFYATALFFYDANASYKYITRALKYHGELGQGRFFSNMLGAEMASSALYADVDAVVPVPLHWTRLLQRGYNQAEVIADEVGRCLGAKVFSNMLHRCSRTRSQTHLSLDGRAQNVASAFKVSKRCVRRLCLGNMNVPHHILLVDDVFTTGATVHSCIAALRRVFPSSVRISVATLAVVGR